MAVLFLLLGEILSWSLIRVKSKVAYQMSELIDQISQNKSELLKAEFSFFNDTLSSIVIISFIIFLIILKLLVFCG